MSQHTRFWSLWPCRATNAQKILGKCQSLGCSHTQTLKVDEKFRQYLSKGVFIEGFCPKLPKSSVLAHKL